jgi:2-amino-4-hydroxy-6-hydroxymethyldihydropteridine diphosphokinase
MKVYLSLGSNSGNRRHNIVQACRLIEAEAGTIVQKSKVIKTKAWGYSDSDYLNCALEVETDLKPEQLLKATQRIEKQLGRSEKTTYDENGNIKYVSRPIDVDILFYGNQIIENEAVCIPHKLMHMREFVLTPLCEIAPDFIHPVLETSITELSSRLKNMQFSTAQ